MSAAVILPDVEIRSGELYLADSPTILRTILGSCVGVTFWSARVGAGGLCHAMLPRCPRIWPAGSTPSESYRYVDFSVRYLAQQFDALGACRSEVEVKLFGGADVLLIREHRNGRLTVGAQNSQAAIEVLAEKGFTVCASDLGGIHGRKIHFHTGTGAVLLQRLVGC